MMTFYTVLQLCFKWRLDPERTYVTISRAAANVNGTTADLVEGDILTVNQLFYGLMLPSGNDSGFALAEYFGELLKEKKSTNGGGLFDNSSGSPYSTHPTVKYFLKEMNNNADKLNMMDSFYDSPHGLKNVRNFSSAYDVCLLVTECMKIKKFWDVVSTPYLATRAVGNEAASRNGQG
jgi:serine-type D-Ala-D-Ala carboxypeptidase (penicillin-binding protein 5/6)